jgi:hypothetical protein
MKGEPVRVTLAPLALGISTFLVAIGASPSIAQTRVTSLEELRRMLAGGDVITIVPTAGQPIAGRLIRFGEAALDVRVAGEPTLRTRGPHVVTIPLDAIQSLERRRDSARNGAVIGAVIGAGLGGGMFAYASVIDRNEMNEWAPFYVRATAVSTAISALIGWSIDAAHSKPHIRFEPSSGGRSTVSVQPVVSRHGGIAVAVSLSR